MNSEKEDAHPDWAAFEAAMPRRSFIKRTLLALCSIAIAMRVIRAEPKWLDTEVRWTDGNPPPAFWSRGDPLFVRRCKGGPVFKVFLQSAKPISEKEMHLVPSVMAMNDNVQAYYFDGTWSLFGEDAWPSYFSVIPCAVSNR